MSDTSVQRLAGAAGLLFLILFIPSYLAAPDDPVATSTAQQVLAYFKDRQGQILTVNGAMLIFAGFFFLWFIGILHDLTQAAEAGRLGFSSVVLAGGVMFVALMLAGAAAEILHAASQARFQNFREDAQLGFLSLTMAGWLYRFAFVGMAVMIAATSAVALRTSLFPAWFGWIGFVVAIVALLRYFGPLGGWLCMAWIAVVSAFMLASMFGRTRARNA
jgi:hypothetical protein